MQDEDTTANAPAARPRSSARNDEVYGLGAFAFLIGLNIEGDTLSFVQRFEPGPLDRRDVNENVTPPVIRLDEAVATFGIEELHRTCHCHWDTPNPKGTSAAGPHGATARQDIRVRG